MESWTTYKNENINSGITSINFPKKGKVKWVFNSIGAMYKDLIIVNNRVIFGCELGFIYCLDLFSGELNWQYELDSKRISNPVANNDIVSFISGEYIYAIDVNEGDCKFRTFIGSNIPVGNPRIFEDLIFFGYKDGLGKITYQAINSNSGKSVWIYETDITGDFFPAIIYAEMLIFPVAKCVSKECQLVSINIKNGKEVWRFTDKFSLSPGDNLKSYIHSTCPIVHYGLIYFMSLGGLFLINPKNGTVLNAINFPRTYRTYYQITIKENKLYYVHNTSLVEYDLNFKKVTNVIDTRSSILTPIISSGNFLGFSSISDFYIYDIVKKNICIKFKPKGTIYSNPAFSNNLAIVATSGKKVYCIE